MQKDKPTLGRPASRGAAVFCLLLALGCGSREQAPPADAVAIFDGGFVTAADVEALGPSIKLAGDQNPAGNQDPGEARAALVARVALCKALAAQAPVAEPQLDSAISTARDRVLRDAMLTGLGLDRITVTEAEMRAQYDSHPEQYHDPEKLRLQHIYLRSEAATASAEERDAVRRKLERIRQEIADGADFSAMARQHSQSADAHSGGWTSLKPDSPVLRSFTEAAWSLDIDEVSEVVETPNGFHLIKLRERMGPIDRPFENVVEFVRQRVVADKAQQITDDFVRRAGERYGLVTRYDRLDDPMIAGDEPLITIGEFRFTFDDLTGTIPQELEEQLYNHYFPKVYRFLDSVVRDRLLVLEAHRTGLADDPKVATSLQTAETLIRAEHSLAVRFDERAAEVPDEQLREYFWQNEQRYQTLRVTDLSVMLLLYDDGEPLFTTLKRAEGLADEIRAGASFEELARRYSQHYSASNGGRMPEMTDHGIAHRLQSTAKFRRELDGLAVGEISKPMVAECYDGEQLRFVPTGILFVRKDGEIPPEQQDFETVREMVRQNYLRRNYSDLEAEILRDLQDEIGLQIDSAKLPAL